MFFFTKTAITRERKVKKSTQTWKMNRLSEVYKRAVDQNLGFMAKIRILGPKKHTFLSGHHVLAATGKGSAKKKVPFSKIDISLLRNFVFFGINRIFGQKDTFWPYVKTTVSL